MNEYPKILYYTTNRGNMTEDEKSIIWNRAYNGLFESLKKKHMNANDEDIIEMAGTGADTILVREMSCLSSYKKEIVNNAKEEVLMKKIIESDSNFLRWC